MRILLALAVLAPQEDPAPLLKAFREEFVELTPGKGAFPEGVDHDFHIAKYEVPQNLWQAVMGENPSRWKGKRNSVELFTYGDAELFCGKATALLRAGKLIGAGEVVRIPSEAEWEYAARAGTKTKYSFGDDPKELGAYAWFTGNAAGNDPPVGAKKPNPWGLYDVHGYLWEWCTGGVLRGGSWKDPAERLETAVRWVVEPKVFKDDAVGLRCVLAKEKK